MKKLAVAVLAVLLLVIPIAGVGADSHLPSPETIVKPQGPGNGGFWACPDGQKIEDPATGSYTLYFDGYAGEIEITVNPDNTFSFETDHNSHVVETVLVKGGPNALLWDFGGGVGEAAGLHAPSNTKNGKYYGLSHLCFLTDKK